MTRYLLSIGGAGHRTLASAVFLAAAGAFGRDDIRILCVDNDATNGNLNHTLQLIDLYAKIRGADRWLGDTPLFAPALALVDRKPWVPTLEDGATTMDSYFQHQRMKQSNETMTAVYEFLYDPAKRSMSVTEGFRARPSVGAAVYRAASRQVLGEGDALRRFREGLIGEAATGEQARLFAIGSIFGGTGAAGLPTLPANIIDEMRQHHESVVCGGAFLLPYFKFKAEELDNEGAHANPDDFILMMKDALEYYQRHPGRYDRVYVIGADEWREQPKAAVGREDQRNPANLVEFLAAVAASNYYETWVPPEQQENGRTPTIAILHRGGARQFTWSDLPESGRLKPLLGRLTRFSFLYLAKFHKLLESAPRDKSIRNQTWFRHHIEGAGVRVNDPAFAEQIELLQRFCRLLLLWWDEIHQPGGIEAQLVNTYGFRDDRFPASNYSSLMREPHGTGRNMDDALRAVGQAPMEEGHGIAGLGAFVNALYKVVSSEAR